MHTHTHLYYQFVRVFANTLYIQIFVHRYYLYIQYSISFCRSLHGQHSTNSLYYSYAHICIYMYIYIYTYIYIYIHMSSYNLSMLIDFNIFTHTHRHQPKKIPFAKPLVLQAWRLHILHQRSPEQKEVSSCRGVVVS